MKKTDKKRLKELFSATFLLRRIYLHQMQRETVDLAAQMLVVMRYDDLCAEARRLDRMVAK
ncbi:MAG: hypothetical protein WBQ94_04195 [Terracidiphilus sp.]